MPKPRTFARAFDKSRNVSDNKTVVKHSDNAEIGIYGCEMIIRDFGFCGSQHGKQSRFSDVGKTYKSDVGNGFQFQRDLMFFGDFAELRKRGGLSLRVSKTRVAFAASAALKCRKSVAVLEKVGYHVSVCAVFYDRSRRNFYDKVRTAFARAVFRSARSAVFRAEMFAKFEIRKRVYVLVRNKHDVTAVSAVTAVGSAVGNVLFAVEGNDAVSAVACLDENLYIIEKHINLPVCRRREVRQELPPHCVCPRPWQV